MFKKPLPFLLLFFALQHLGQASASERCPEPTSFISDSQGQVTSKYIDFLICLHNEQVNSINDLYSKVPSSGDAIEMRNTENDIALLRQQVRMLEGVLDTYLAKVKQLENQVTRLGMQLEK